MLNFCYKKNYVFSDLVSIMDVLRSEEGGCPWDREQDHRSIRRNLLEEAYEAAEAIDLGDSRLLCEELGDVLLQIVFHAKIEKDSGGFDIDDVCDGICKKLILRHPHVFSDVRADTPEEVLENWDEIKKAEKGHKSQSEAMRSIAKSLPALLRAEKIQAKAAKAGFDFENIEGAFSKLEEETDELSEALKDPARACEELGDLLFAAVNVSRFLKADPEELLTKSSEKFISRFSYVEEAAVLQSRHFGDMTAEEMDMLWEKAKKK